MKYLGIAMILLALVASNVTSYNSGRAAAYRENNAYLNLMLTRLRQSADLAKQIEARLTASSPMRQARQCTLSASLDLVECPRHTGCLSGNAIYFLGPAGGVTPYRTYYVAVVMGSGTFTISEQPGGAACDLRRPDGANLFARTKGAAR